MKAQTIFNRVARHLLRQNAKSEGVRCGATTCLYRGPQGRRCAIGIFITDENYTRRMETHNLTTLLQMYEDRVPSWFTEHQRLLRALQRLHDEEWVTDWRTSLAQIARSFGLDDSVLA